MRITKIFSLFLLLVLLIPEFSIGNDTLVFVKKKKSDKEFRLPLNAYPVYLKKSGAKKIQCIIQSATDSSLMIRVYHNNKNIRKRKNAAADSLWRLHRQDTGAEQTLKLMNLTDSLYKSIEYRGTTEIKISSIKYLKIYNGYRKEMRKILTVNDAVMAISVLLFPFVILALLIAPPFIFVLLFTLALMVCSAALSLFIEFKKLDLKKKWQIRR